MSWRAAKSLITLRDQVNALAPNRSKAADGLIGDAAHSSRTSDHNPDPGGVVRALDLTHDPSHGFDSWAFAEMLRLRKDKRIKYVISNKRIFAGDAGPSPWVWRSYTGSNPHSHHVHVSVVAGAAGDETRSWDIGGDWNVGKDTPPTPPSRPLLRRGSKGENVKTLQSLLGGLDVDGDFGQKTDAAVRAFQKSKGLVVDGLVGVYTWAALLA